jgi:hypothetical protein
MTLEGSRIRPMPGSPTARSRNWSIWPNARVSNCARAICGWPSAPPSWSGRYTHAHQFKRARRELKFLRTRLGRIIRDIRRKIEGNPALEERFAPLLDLAAAPAQTQGLFSACARGRMYRQRQGPRALRVRLQTRHRPTAIRMTAIRSAPVINGLQALTGIEPRRVHIDKGYRGHNYPDRFKVWIAGQVRRVTKTIRREMKRKAAVEPSSATSRPITAWAEITSRAAKATASTRCSPPQDSTSACCYDGSNGFCAPCLPPSAAQSSLPASHKQAKDYFLHGRLRTLMSLKSHHSSGPFSGLRRR